MSASKAAAVLLVGMSLVVGACSGAAPADDPTQPPDPTATPVPSHTPTPTLTPTPTQGPCAGEWVGEWTLVDFETNTGGIILPTYTITGKRLTLLDSCTYTEDWAAESSDIGCQSFGLINGEYSISGDDLAFAPLETVTELSLDCGGGAQISGSAPTTPLHDVPLPGYRLDREGLPSQLRLAAAFLTEQGFEITITQVFEP